MDRPNIVIITCHDAGCHFGCYGVPTVDTPNIDQLAAEGIRFTRMYATASMCSPSRGSLLTGQYPATHGLIGLAGRRYRWELTDPKRHLSHQLRKAGYTTSLIGHQHETADVSRLGFDHLACLDSGQGSLQQAHPIHDSSKAAYDYILSQADADRPFYLQYGTHETHTPYDFDDCPPSDRLGTWIPPYCLVDDDDPEAEALKKHIAGLQGSLRRLDRAVGTILDALRLSGQSENTLVIFTSDHGPELPRAKWTTYDAGSRVAFIARWPEKKLEGGRACNLLLSNVDVVPTLAEWLALDIDHAMEGRSFASAITRKNAPPDAVRDAVYTAFMYNLNYGIRTLTHSASMNFRGWYAGRPESEVPFFEAFNLKRDPYEQHNIAELPSASATAHELELWLWRHLEQTQDPVLLGDYGAPPYICGAPGERMPPCETHAEALRRYDRASREMAPRKMPDEVSQNERAALVRALGSNPTRITENEQESAR